MSEPSAELCNGGRDGMNAGYAAHVMDNQTWASGQLGSAAVNEMLGGAKALNKMSKGEVYTIAKRMGIAGRSLMKKDELIAAIRKAAAALRRKIRRNKAFVA